MNAYKSFFTISFIVLFVRIIGFIREILFVHFYGVSVYTDAFNVAFRIPNLICKLFTEEIFTQTFMPILIEYKNKKNFSIFLFKKLINNVTTVLMWITFLVTISGMILSSFILNLILAKIDKHKELFVLASSLIKIIFPYICCSAYLAVSRCILNTHKKFKISSITSVMLNVFFIINMYLISPYFNCPIYSMSLSVLLSGITQILLQFLSLKKIKIFPRIYLNIFSSLKDSKVRFIFKKMIFPVLSYFILQINILININIASRLKHGSVSWLFYADRLIEFPVSLISCFLYSILLPILSETFVKKKYKEYEILFDYSLRIIFLLICPCVIFLFVLCIPIILTLFFYGKFELFSVNMTGYALMAYTIGLTSLVINKILFINFYINKDTTTPIKISLFIIIVCQIMNYFFVPYLQHAGLALSTGLTSILSSLFLFFIFKYKKSISFQKGWFKFFMKLFFALTMMFIFAFSGSRCFDWIKYNAYQRITSLLFILVVCIFIYLTSLFLIGFKFNKIKKVFDVYSK